MKVAIKWGIINAHGEEILSVEYCNVWNFYGKNRYTVRLEKDGVSSDFTLRHKPSFFPNIAIMPVEITMGHIMVNFPEAMHKMSWDIVMILSMMLLRVTLMHIGILIE